MRQATQKFSALTESRQELEGECSATKIGLNFDPKNVVSSSLLLSALAMAAKKEAPAGMQQRILDEMLKQPENKNCADCGARGG